MTSHPKSCYENCLQGYYCRENCLQGYYKAYGRSLWLTEFALADFGGPSNGWAWTFATYEQQLAFMKQVETLGVQHFIQGHFFAVSQPLVTRLLLPACLWWSRVSTCRH